MFSSWIFRCTAALSDGPSRLAFSSRKRTDARDDIGDFGKATLGGCGRSFDPSLVCGLDGTVIAGLAGTTTDRLLPELGRLGELSLPRTTP